MDWHDRDLRSVAQKAELELRSTFPLSEVERLLLFPSFVSPLPDVIPPSPSSPHALKSRLLPNGQQHGENKLQDAISLHNYRGSHPLRALVETILSGIETLELVHETHGIPLPSLDNPYRPTALENDSTVAHATHLIISAAAQLIATARKPVDTLQHYTLGMYLTTSLGFAVETHLADILKTGGPQGMHTTEIAAINGVEATNTGRVLRHLAAHHVFKEVTPNVFANNHVSLALAKTKSLEEIEKDPCGQYEGAGGVAWIAQVADVSLKSSTTLSSFLIDPRGRKASFNIAINETLSLWEWLKKPENFTRHRRFIEAMKGAAAHYPPELYTTAIDWSGLKPNNVVVDVGGGVGNVTLILANKYPQLHYVVQDLEKVSPDASKFWATTTPDHIAEGRVRLQAHDFFVPQPVKKAAVYFMRFIIHDWPDAENLKILRNIREAAGPLSKLILFDIVLSHACRTKKPIINGSSERMTPVEILPEGVDWATAIDLQMLSLFNARERTLDEFIVLGERSGWKFEALRPGRPLSALVFSPA